MKARIRGIQSFMGKFGFQFGCHLRKRLLPRTDNLSKTIQKPETSAVEAQSLAESFLSVLVSDRSDETFQLFWERVQLSKVDLDVDDTQVSRKRKVLSRFESGERESYLYHENPGDKYKQVYYEATDRVTACIRERFEQKDYQVCAKMQEILLSAVHKQECSEDDDSCVYSFYGDDFCKARWKDQLRLLPTMATDHAYNLPNMTIADFIRFIQSLSAAECHFLSEVATLTKLMLVCERSFSSLKRLETYLRFTMADEKVISPHGSSCS